MARSATTCGLRLPNSSNRSGRTGTRRSSFASAISAPFAKDYVKQALEDEIGELTSLDQEVIESLQQHELLTENIEKQFERKLTFGEHLSDKIAEFGGSWKFIITFGSVLVVWIMLNGCSCSTAASILTRSFY